MDYSQYKNLIEANRQADPESFDEIKERVIVNSIRNGYAELGIPKRSLNEELSLHKEAIKHLYDLVTALMHYTGVDSSEFMRYYNDTELLKSKSKESIV